jgi:hypothetical protein
MERIEVNVQTGEVRTIQLTTEEVAAAEAQYAAWLAEQPVVANPTPADPTPVDPNPPAPTE